VRRKYKNKTVVFVTHSVVIKAILSFLMKKYHEDIEDQKVENASISIVEFKNNKPKIIFINYTKHLKNK
jgi:broad specificity phosphatase PhoE